jgi:hypothetical protein
MKGYTCDQCGKSKSGTPAVEIRGVARRSGILLASALQEHVFCGANCFWIFFNEQGPAYVVRIPEMEHDVSKDRARVLHRIVRALHDGNCPKCGALHHPDEITVPGASRARPADSQFPTWKPRRRWQSFGRSWRRISRSSKNGGLPDEQARIH